MKKKWINFLVREIFVAVPPHDILREVHGQWYFNGRAISRQDMERLKFDAERLVKSKLWQILSTEYRFKASQLIAYKSSTIEDTLFGKALLYWIEVTEEHLDLISKS